MEQKNFFEEIALACTDESTRVRQTMYSILHSEKTIEQTEQTMVGLIVNKFMEKIDDHKLLQFFNSTIGYTDRELYQKAEKNLAYEMITSSLTFPKMEKGFILSQVGHYFKEEDLLEIFDGFDLFAQAISLMNQKIFGRTILVTFKGANIYGGETIELYFAGGQCPVIKDKKKR